MDELTAERFMDGWAIRNSEGVMVGFTKHPDWKEFLRQFGVRADRISKILERKTCIRSEKP